MMGHLMAVKDKQSVADNMFEPLKETIELLKTYGQELPDEVHQQLQVHAYRCCIECIMSCACMSDCIKQSCAYV